jgi:hypothetical protein
VQDLRVAVLLRRGGLGKECDCWRDNVSLCTCDVGEFYVNRHEVASGVILSQQICVCLLVLVILQLLFVSSARL